MDLQGSLIDTNLRIYPSNYLISYLKSQPMDDNVPENIIRLINGKCESQQKEILKDTNKIYIHLNNEDIENLNKIQSLHAIEDEEIQKAAKMFEEESIHVVETLVKSDKEGENMLQMECNEKFINIEENSKKKASINSNESTKKSKEECNEKLKANCNEDKDNGNNDKEEEFYLTTSDLDWLYQYLQKSKLEGKEDVPYLNVLLKNAQIKTPNNKLIKRNPVLEARCVKLRAQQEAREYRKMTKSVDNVRMRFPEDSISFQLKQVNRHLIAIGQFIISIFAGFLFGFKGVEWMIGSLDFGFRLLLGVMCATIISLAEIYFLAKKLNEELDIPETVQLGGPPKFADKDKYYEQQLKNKAVNKEHQD